MVVACHQGYTPCTSYIDIKDSKLKTMDLLY